MALLQCFPQPLYATGIYDIHTRVLSGMWCGDVVACGSAEADRDLYLFSAKTLYFATQMSTNRPPV